MRSENPILWGYASVVIVTCIAVAAAISIGGTMTLSVPPFVVFALAIAFVLAMFRPLQLVFQAHPSPLRQIGEDIGGNWAWLLGLTLMLVALPLHFDATTRIKQSIPNLQPFYADESLIMLDRLMFAGHDAWEITHAVLGEIGTRAIDLAYAGWLFVQVAMTVFLVLSRNHWFKIRVGLSLQMAWLLLGGGLAVAFASVGPCFVDDFYGSSHFSPLMARLESYHGLLALDGMNYLLKVQGQLAVGGGISAMPSLHVGVASLILLAVREFWRRWQPLACLYLIVIYVGSIHLGWHYASDGLVSGLGVWAIWIFCGRYCDWLRASGDHSEQEMVGADGLEPPTLSV